MFDIVTLFIFSNWAPSPDVKFEISSIWLAPIVPIVKAPPAAIVASPLTFPNIASSTLLNVIFFSVPLS